MESEGDPFQKFLLNRIRNLRKKIERIDQKSKKQNKNLQADEKKFLESRPHVVNQIKELERSYAQYCSSLEKTAQPVIEKVNQIDQSHQVVALWVLSEFIRYEDIWASLDLQQKETAQGLLDLLTAIKGNPQDSFESIKMNTYQIVESYLKKSQAVIQNSNLTYFMLNNFVGQLLGQFGGKVRPATPVFRSGESGQKEAEEEKKFEDSDDDARFFEEEEEIGIQPPVEIHQQDPWDAFEQERKKPEEVTDEEEGFVMVEGKGRRRNDRGRRGQPRGTEGERTEGDFRRPRRPRRGGEDSRRFNNDRKRRYVRKSQ